MIKQILHVILALMLAAGIAALLCRGRGGPGRGVAAGVAAGIIGLGILGAAASARGRGGYYADDDDYDDGGGCYRGPRRCGWENRRCFENRYGDYRVPRRRLCVPPPADLRLAHVHGMI